MGDVFISYKQDERERMRPIANGLRELGVDVWFDERLQPDRSFTEEIQDVMSRCKAQIVCWSPAAMASEWVRGEAEFARQRAVLVAVLIEPCTLLPPFNMHHAENLAGWTGDPRHPGWRKVCDAIGRRLGREGLGELAALQASDDAAAWKKWAQRFPNDPAAEVAWAKAEELEIGAARARMARDREAATRIGQRAARDGVAAPPLSPPAHTPPPAPARGGSVTTYLIAGAVVALFGAGAASYFLWPRGGGEIVAEAPTLDAPAVPESAVTEVDASPTAPEPPASQQGAAASAPAVDPAAAAIAVINSISVREWAQTSTTRLMERVVASSAIASLRAAADAGNARAQVLFGIANDQFDDDPLPYNPQIAERYYRRSAEQGDAIGQFYHARQIWVPGGRGIDATQYAEAERWYKRSADQGFAAAQVNLGQLYVRASGVDRPADYATAARYYRLAADQGNTWAMAELGQLYLTGSGVRQDRGEGLRLLREAARRDNTQAQYTLRNLNEAW